jgi:long-chain acyl-CoA synthetase
VPREAPHDVRIAPHTRMNLASLADKNLAEHGDYERLVFEGETYTNRELHEKSCRLSAAFIELGLRKDDKVVMLMPNGPEVLVTYPAIWRAGLVSIPVLFLLDAHELAAILEGSGAKAIVTSPELYPKVVEATRRLAGKPHVILTGREPETPPGCIRFDELVSKGDPREDMMPRGDGDLATILYTSGTTARPKGVMQTHDNLYANAMNVWNTATHRRPHETSLLVLPLAHSFGLNALLSGYLFGSRAVLQRWFQPERALELIERYKVQSMAGVPTMFIDMLMHPNAQRYDTSSVTRWLVAAAPMPTELLRDFERKFGGTMYVGYGLSEACAGVATEREGMPRKLGSTGMPVHGVLVKIVDDAGREAPRGTIGEVCAKGPNVSPGYYENPGATAEAFRDGWLHTGDLGYLDEDGYLFIVDRKKDLIIRGGLNIYPGDVEQVIRKHPSVHEVAVVGVPDVRLGEEVCAYVVKRPGTEISAEEIVQHCQQNLAKYKTPRYVELVDALPRTNIGKVQKKALRERAARQGQR